jgi:hypothetical protein
MQQHGGNPASILWPMQENLARAGRVTKPVSPPDPAGFRHFFERSDGRSTLLGESLNPAEKDVWKRAEELMAKLTQLCMVAPAAPTSRENQDVPSGYTYLLQLVAHDIVHSSILLSRSNELLYAFANTRDMPLRLQTIYGAGPSQCPHVYEADPEFRHLLRLGKTRKPGNGPRELINPSRDVARGTAGSAVDCKPDQYSEPCVADPRNDSHAIISQMITAFHMLHNEIYAHLDELDVAPADPIGKRTERLFVATYVACTLIYRAIVIRDLLPKVLHPDVIDAYRSRRVLPVTANVRADQWAAPLELTHGVMRCAHAMVRPHYSLNEITPFPTDASGSDGSAFAIASVLGQNSQAVDRMPFERKWIVDWRRFFGPTAVNFSMLISPLGNQGLEIGIQATDRSKLLLERDLLSSLAVRPLSVGALVSGLQQTHGDLIGASAFLALNNGSGQPGWFAPISDWLTDQNRRRGNLMDAHEIETLAKDPPLPFFTRFEAEQDPDGRGKHLGRLGSIILADVIYGILKQDPLVGIDSLDSLKSQLEILAGTLVNSNGHADEVFKDQKDMDSFERVIKFLGDKVTFPPAG